MRVLHVLRATGVAGAERHVLALLAGLRDSGLDAQLALLTARRTPTPDLEAQLRNTGIPFQSFPMRGHVDVTLLGRLRALTREGSRSSSIRISFMPTSTARWRRVWSACRRWSAAATMTTPFAAASPGEL